MGKMADMLSEHISKYKEKWGSAPTKLPLSPDQYWELLRELETETNVAAGDVETFEGIRIEVYNA